MKIPKFIAFVSDPSIVDLIQTRLGDEYLVIAVPEKIEQHLLFVRVPQD